MDDSSLDPTTDRQVSETSEQGLSKSIAHKRTYQACLPCRRRKVRCDLGGDVDNPGDPPCSRCRREKKECVFSETRRKRKADDEDGGLTEEYIQRNKRVGATRSNHDDTIVPTNGNASHSNGYNDLLLGGKKKDLNEPVRNEAAQALFGRTITTPSDALNMLVDAASRTEVEDMRRNNSVITLKKEPAAPVVDPALVASQGNPPIPDARMAKACMDWASIRFVRAGWFTPQEGIAYVQFFYEHLAPLTPVSPPDFSDPGKHEQLLNDEPMLTVTILTIASRYLELQGPGAKARSFWIHDKMWNYLQNMITRMFWGQEGFGGGFCGAGRFGTVEQEEARRRGLRSLGTVESLLLLSDWLPRSMHFPPGDDGDDIMVAPPANPFGSPELFGTVAKNPHTDWTEPAIRSDRMCWSLVGTAYTLAFELGVFDSLIESGKWKMGRQVKTFYDPERADRIGRLLFVYVSQTCGRLGFPNMMPHQGTEHDFDFLKMDVPEGTYVGPYNSITTFDRTQRAWAELTALMRQSNTDLFESKQRTYDSIKSGTYMQFLEKYVPKLKEWKGRFEQTSVPHKARLMLLMEYEYSRTYINSLALQAVLDIAIESESAEQDPQQQSTGNTPPAFISSKTVDLKEKNKPYITELTEAARNLLTLAVEDLHKIGALRNAPVRTHFRILSGAMFLLKTFALGGTTAEVHKSLELLDKTVKTLKISVPDDVHLSLRISELLASLSAAIKTKFVRLHVAGKSTKRATNAKNTTSNPSSTGKGVHSTSTNPSGLHARTYSYGAMGIQPRDVDLADSNTTIMPPPNFSIHHNSTFGDSFAVADSPSTPTGGYSATSPADMRPRHNSNSAFSPGNAFSPISTGSGGQQGYDWLTLDMNPLIQSMHHNAAGNTQSTPTSQNGHAGLSAVAPGNGSIGPRSRGASPTIPGFDFGVTAGSSAWTNGAFGPQISEDLEWLGALGTGPGGFPDWQGDATGFP